MEIEATLRIMGELLDPEQVSRMLGVQADASHRPGEPRATTAGRALSPYRAGLWCYHSKAASTAPLDEHLSSLLAFAEAHREELAGLQEDDVVIDIFLGVFAPHVNVGLDLAPTLLARIGEAELVLCLDIYCQGGCELCESPTSPLLELRE